MRSRTRVESLSDLCYQAEQLQYDLMHAEEFEAAYYGAKLVTVLRRRVREERESEGKE